MTTPQDKELALRIAAEIQDQCQNGASQSDLVELLNRYHTAKLEQYGKVLFDCFPQAHRLALELEALLLSCDDTSATAKWWDSANEALEQWREFCREELPQDAQGLSMDALANHEETSSSLQKQLLTAQAEANKLREALDVIANHPIGGASTERYTTRYMRDIAKTALSTPTNTDEADKLIKAMDVAKGALETIADTDPDDGTMWFHETADKALTTINELGLTK